jgi:hypothetical protein
MTRARAQQIQILLTERLYPDIRSVLEETKALTGLVTNAQVTAFALRDLRNRLAREMKVGRTEKRETMRKRGNDL